MTDGSLSDSANLTVYITDVNEPPSMVNLPQSVSVLESQVTPKVVFTIMVTDEDAGDSATLIINDTQPAGAPFTVHSTSGEF